MHEFDVISVQSGGLRKANDGSYASTHYTDVDDFGMLGGYVRVLAAQELYRQSPATPFVFCNGKSAKQVAKFGADVPTDAEIYAAEFRRGVGTAAPEILLEDISVNTAASISSLITMCIARGWKRMGLVSSDYHIPRIQALCDLIFKKLGKMPVAITCISAEAVLKELRPGVYDDEIDAAYKTPAARQRIKNEQNGLKNIQDGSYHIGEFQLAPRKKGQTVRIQQLLDQTGIQQLALPANFNYGTAIYKRGAVEIISQGTLRVEAWVGGLDGSVKEGGGSRRRTQLFVKDGKLAWHCAGNPKKHDIFCKHCVALALTITNAE